MGLIAKTGRKHPGIRMLLISIFLILTLGAVSMLVPFFLMLSGSTRTGIDLHEFSLVPEFLLDDELLFQKYVEGLYNESPSSLRSSWGTEHKSFADLRLLETPDYDRLFRWLDFVEESRVQDHETFTGFAHTPVSRGRPLSIRLFMQEQVEKFDGDVMEMNEALGSDFPDWNAFHFLPADTRSRQGVEPDSAFLTAWRMYSEEKAPVWTKGIHSLDRYYHERITKVLSGEEAEKKHLTPVADAELPDWEFFVREVVHPGYVRMDPKYSGEWRELLKSRYGNLESFLNIKDLPAERWEEITLPDSLKRAGDLDVDWLAFLEGWQDLESGRVFKIPLDGMGLESIDLKWREETGTGPPMRLRDQYRFEQNRSAIRRMFLFQNYATVWEILIVHGRGLWVTVVYCAGSVLIALIVNPMAAYALSRFRPKNSYAILLYLLLTMAFPPMVTQIPLFLMLRDLNLLNTFWALLLPGMAHGYSIFLLKGFFDSLPRELYESASLDGAGELRMFAVITLGLSKPILAVIALSAFVNAYTAFMFALLICQDERMWTLMVWLYQLQQNYGPGVMNAAFVLAAVPTLLVFLLAQRQILRGIVVPSEK